MLVRVLTTLSLLVATSITALGTARAQTAEPGSAQATLTATSVPATPVAAATAEPATPLPQPDKGMTVVGYIIQDTNGDGVRSAGDKPAQTLVQLHRLSAEKVGSGANVGSDQNGRFEFTNVSQGQYLLSVWWSPGFVTLQGQSASSVVADHPDVVLLKLEVTSDGSSSFQGATLVASDPSSVAKEIGPSAATEFTSLTFLVKPLPEGLIPYPVSVGGDALLPVGSASLPQVSMPSSGDAEGGSGRSWAVWLVSLSATVFLGATALLLLESRRRARSP